MGSGSRTERSTHTALTLPASGDERPGVLDRLAVFLGLGEVVAGSERNLKPGDVNPVWAVDTAEGQWVIKTARPVGPWWFDQIRQAAVLEEAVVAAGVAVPAPAPPAGLDPVGLWSKINDRAYARAMRRLDGVNPSPDPVSTTLAHWLGATLAAVESAAPPAQGHWSSTGYATHPLAQWQEWLGEARSLGWVSSAEAATAASLVADLNRVVDNAVRGDLELKLLHRDVSRANILLAPAGPVLLDFDCAGPQQPWWEAIGHIFALAAPEHGLFVPEQRPALAALDSYRAAGGSGGAADPEAFAGMIAARLRSASFLLWNACGHRGGDAAWHQRCATGFRRSVSVLDSIAASMTSWATWLE